MLYYQTLKDLFIPSRVRATLCNADLWRISIERPSSIIKAAIFRYPGGGT